MAGARQREMAARHEASGAEPRDSPTDSSQRRQRKRQGRVTDAPAHIPATVSMNGRMASPQPSGDIRSCRDPGGPQQRCVFSPPVGVHSPGPRRRRREAATP